MSLFLDSREILVGLQETQQKDDAAIRALSCFYVQSDPKPKSETQFYNENKNMVGGSEKVGAFCFEDSCESSESSSIGAAESYVTDDLDDGSIDAEVQSKLQSPLGSMVSLEESLPIKRGLSNFFSGKSKSFTSLLEASTVKELAKPENPFNKRRRTLLACKRGSSYCNLLGPDFALEETEEEEEGGENRDIYPANLPIQGRRKHKSFADLQQYGS